MPTEGMRIVAARRRVLLEWLDCQSIPPAVLLDELAGVLDGRKRGLDDSRAALAIRSLARQLDGPDEMASPGAGQAGSRRNRMATRHHVGAVAEEPKT